MPEIVLVHFRDEETRLDERLSCVWEMNGSLSEIRNIVERARLPKKKKVELLAQIDHIYCHLADETRIMCNDAKDRLQ